MTVAGTAVDPTPEEAFRRIADAYVDRPGVTTGTGFGGNEGLRFEGRIFAMLVRGELVVKLTPERVTSGIAGGEGRAFEPGTGRVMRAWFTSSLDRVGTWRGLVDDAFDLATNVRGGA